MMGRLSQAHGGILAEQPGGNGDLTCSISKMRSNGSSSLEIGCKCTTTFHDCVEGEQSSTMMPSLSRTKATIWPQDLAAGAATAEAPAASARS